MNAPKVYRYARFSHSAQSEGMSLERQADAAEAWARQRGMVIDDSHAYVDEGVSASKGKNLARGALARILTAVKARDIQAGSYLIIESVSRFSRLLPRLSSKILETLVAAGIRVVFLDTGMEYNGDTIDQLGNDVVFRVNASAAAEYSRTLKGYKLKAWERARGLMRTEGKVSTRMLPYWLTCEVVTDAQGRRGRGAIGLHPVYAPIVKRIFAEYLAGRGKQQIAQRLNIDNVPSPPRVGSETGAEHWRHGLIGRTLANPAVCGVFQPHREIDAPRVWTLEALTGALMRKRQTTGDAIPGYYPRVISDETFAAGAAMREGNRAKAGAKIQGRSDVTHILANLARCPVCDSNMKRANKGDRRYPPRYVCSKALSGKAGACQRVSVPVSDVEKALIGAADALGAGAPGADPTIAAELAALETRHGATAAKVATLTVTVEELIDRVESVPSAMSAKLAKLETERDALAGELTALRAKATAVQPNVVKMRLGNMVGALKAYAPGDPLGVEAPTVNAALFACFSRVVISYDTRELFCYFRHGPPPSVVRY
jgi:DNA invertase Pin-like site-specific DNA recombinase